MSADRGHPAIVARSPTSPRSIFQSYWSSPTRKGKAAADKNDDDEAAAARLQALQLPHLPGTPRPAATAEEVACGGPPPSCLRRARYSCPDLSGCPRRGKDAVERGQRRPPFRKSVSFHDEVEVLEYELEQLELVDRGGWENFFAWGGA